jgi:hypothetical protein
MKDPSPSPRSDKPASGGAERRRFARTNADLPISVRLPTGPTEARVRDISRAGVCFFLDRAIPLMTVLEVDLDLGGAKGRQRVRGNGAVVRCERISKAVDHYEIAVYLHDMLDADRRALEEYVGGVGRAARTN